jgi:hypothetical protein
MRIRTLIWIGTAIDAVLLLPGLYMAISAVDVAGRSNGDATVIAVVVLFFALPVFCVAAPAAAWRAHARRKHDLHPVLLVFSPLVYAAFLVVFLFTN